MIDADTRFRGTTTVFLTADHGSIDKDHFKNLLVEVYTIPVYIWGAGGARGLDLYRLNKTSRLDPGKGHPHFSDSVQPERNGDGANLALKLLGLGPIPGSTINQKQDREIRAGS